MSFLSSTGYVTTVEPGYYHAICAEQNYDYNWDIPISGPKDCGQLLRLQSVLTYDIVPF